MQLVRQGTADLRQAAGGRGDDRAVTANTGSFLLLIAIPCHAPAPLRPMQLARHTETNELVAIKFIERGDRVNRYVEAEILNHRMLRHPHVIEFKEVRVHGFRIRACSCAWRAPCA